MGLMKTFAKNMKSARAAQRLSQEKLAQKAGVSTSYVSMLEREQRSPPLETVETIARALKVPPVQLLTA